MKSSCFRRSLLSFLLLCLRVSKELRWLWVVGVVGCESERWVRRRQPTVSLHVARGAMYANGPRHGREIPRAKIREKRCSRYHCLEYK